MGGFLVPLVAGTAASAAGPLIQGTLQNKATRRLRDYNEARISELQNAQGLTPGEQRLLSARLNSPIAAAATAARQRQEELLAGGVGTGGSTSARGLAALRQAQAQRQDAAAQQAALTGVQLNEQAKMQQEAELEQRLQAQAAMQQRAQQNIVNPLVQGFQQGLLSAGAAAGAPPSTFTAGGAPGIGQAIGSLFRQGQEQQPLTGAEYQSAGLALTAAGFEPGQVGQILDLPAVQVNAVLQSLGGTGAGPVSRQGLTEAFGNAGISDADLRAVLRALGL